MLPAKAKVSYQILFDLKVTLKSKHARKWRGEKTACAD
jgi:hypothetical protein